MLGSLLKHLRPRRALAVPRDAAARVPLRLHVGGKEPHPDWKIVNITPGKHTDYVRSCTDLSPFASGTVAEIYASHVLEHLGYLHDLPIALGEFHRVLVPGGTLRVSVPDLATLCSMFLDPELSGEERVLVMRYIFGGQVNAADFHLVGLYEELMTKFLKEAGFAGIRRVDFFRMFADASNMLFHGRPISLNMIARKAPDEA